MRLAQTYLCRNGDKNNHSFCKRYKNRIIQLAVSKKKSRHMAISIIGRGQLCNSRLPQSQKVLHGRTRQFKRATKRIQCKTELDVFVYQMEQIIDSKSQVSTGGITQTHWCGQLLSENAPSNAEATEKADEFRRGQKDKQAARDARKEAATRTALEENNRADRGSLVRDAVAVKRCTTASGPQLNCTKTPGEETMPNTAAEKDCDDEREAITTLDEVTREPRERVLIKLARIAQVISSLKHFYYSLVPNQAEGMNNKPKRHCLQVVMRSSSRWWAEYDKTSKINEASYQCRSPNCSRSKVRYHDRCQLGRTSRYKLNGERQPGTELHHNPFQKQCLEGQAANLRQREHVITAEAQRVPYEKQLACVRYLVRRDTPYIEHARMRKCQTSSEPSREEKGCKANQQKYECYRRKRQASESDKTDDRKVKSIESC